MHTHTHTHIVLMQASALALVMRAAVPIAAVASASVVHCAAVGGAVHRFTIDTISTHANICHIDVPNDFTAIALRRLSIDRLHQPQHSQQLQQARERKTARECVCVCVCVREKLCRLIDFISRNTRSSCKRERECV